MINVLGAALPTAKISISTTTMQPRPSDVVEARRRDVFDEVRIPPVVVDKLEVSEGIGYVERQDRPELSVIFG